MRQPNFTRRQLNFIAPSVIAATSLGTSLLSARPAQAQLINRQFPDATELGLLVVGIFPEVTLNGKPQRLAPGALIRNQDNRIVTPNLVAGPQWVVVYLMDMSGQVGNVWILRDDEIKREQERMKQKRAAAREAAKQPSS